MICNYYLRALYYSPANGRFTQRDTHWDVGNMVYDSNGSVSIEAIFQSGNLYAYCMGNPVNLVDQSGESWQDIWRFICVTGNSLSFELGIGAGFKLSGNLTLSNGAKASLGAGHKADAVNMWLEKGKADIGYKETYGYSMGLGPFGVNSETGVFHSYLKHDGCCLNDNGFSYPLDEYRKCAQTIIYNGYPKSSFSMGFEAYLIFGVTANLSFDYEYWISEIVKIFSGE